MSHTGGEVWRPFCQTQNNHDAKYSSGLTSRYAHWGVKILKKKKKKCDQTFLVEKGNNSSQKSVFFMKKSGWLFVTQ